MPHQCTSCERTFPDGSKQMLSGCPDCGGNRFQFKPGNRRKSDRSGDSTSSTSADPIGPADGADRPRSSATSSATERSERSDVLDREWPQTARPPPADDRPSPDSADSDPGTARSGSPSVAPSSGATGRRDDDGQPPREDTAQASARTDVVSPDELPPRASGPSPTDPGHGRIVREPTDDHRPSLEELREELNEQFESIKVLAPGQYELNLMELYDREEYIISLQEDGRYVIDVPESWRKGPDEE